MRSHPDDFFLHATRMAAGWLSPLDQAGIYLRERDKPPPKVPSAFLQPMVRNALRDLRAGPVDESEITLGLPNWNPLPKGVDVLVRHKPMGNARYVAELKMRDTDQTLWDFYKMVDALNIDGIEAAYLIVGASKRQWGKTSDACTGIFRDEGLDDYPSRKLFENNKKAWWNLLWGGRARPTQIPARVTSRLVEKCELSIDRTEGWLKCVAVEPGKGDPIPFPEDWYHGNCPEGVVPGKEYFDNPPPTGAGGRKLSDFDDPPPIGDGA